MFDALTSDLLSSAPDLPDLNADQIPKLMTKHYAELISERLLATIEVNSEKSENFQLDRMADSYEIIAILSSEEEVQRSAAFVAATAQQIISKKQSLNENSIRFPLINRDGIDPSVASALLFLLAEQFADANEASITIPVDRRDGYEAKILSEHIKDLARGRLFSIIERVNERKNIPARRYSIQRKSLASLILALCEGVEILAEEILSINSIDNSKRFYTSEEAFQLVINLSMDQKPEPNFPWEGPLNTSYAGPAHVANLLLAVSKTIKKSALTKLAPPPNVDINFWNDWLQYRARQTPFIWQNHRHAINSGFYNSGCSAVLVLPTGAGKTTVSSLKIASTLARKKKVVFLAPTHALVEQLTEDLQEIFPSEQFGLDISSDFDNLLVEGAEIKDIEVMTPERCLAMLSFSASSFSNVGLLVFDECHLLSPEAGKIKRALDGMICLLTFNSIASNADMLFLSAMLKNGEQLSDWIAELTGRPCLTIDLLWKPSRQARGVVVYEKTEVDAAVRRAISKQRELDSAGRANSLRVAAKRELTAAPFALWGLQHNWASSNNGFSFTRLIPGALQLGGTLKNGQVWTTPNANNTATQIARHAVVAEMKTIIFVNTKNDSITTARNLAEEIGEVVALTDGEKEIWEALLIELGNAKHSVFGVANFGAVPHNAAMLRLERAISERLFRRADGARVIVATPTLAQGLNLPAHLAIIAGDKRASDSDRTREDLKKHEILNAAARAGRAGHLANGVVLLIPEPLVKFNSNSVLTKELKEKLSTVFPGDDRCVTISDPLEVILDRIMEDQYTNKEVTYTVNRLASIESSDRDLEKNSNLMTRSFGAFIARQKNEEDYFLKKLALLHDEVEEAIAHGPEQVIILMASQTGLPMDLLERLRERLLGLAGSLPTGVIEWIEWTIDWLTEDENSSKHLLSDVSGDILRATGKSNSTTIDGTILNNLLAGILGWVGGQNLRDIELKLGGNPDSDKFSEVICPRARSLVSTVIPRGLSFIMSIISRMVEELDLFSTQLNLDKNLVQSLTTATRKGFDSVEKLEFSIVNKEILSRVQAHKMYESSVRFIDFEEDEDF